MHTKQASLGLAAVLAAIVVPLSLTAPAVARQDTAAVVGVVAPSHDAAGPATLATLLAKFDASKDAAERATLEQQIDKVAGQRYATVSRLYWYRDLEAAQAAARASGKPILSLRMLGRLDEDRSCANSRYFRTTLYANTAVGKLLRERFVLHWSTERPVPLVTIDLGNGRRIETTATGNSAHYVLDARGRVLDVLPGLYAPIAFESELGKSLAFARTVKGLDDDKLRERVAAYHRQQAEEVAARTAKLAGKTRFIVGGRRLVDGKEAVELAQRATMSKAVIEVPVLATIGTDIEAIPDSAIEQWAAIGRDLYSIGRPTTQTPQNPALAFQPRVLDAASVALVTRVHGDASGMPLVLARLEHAIVGDTGINEVKLRQQIRYYLSGGELDFATVNDWVYGAVFHTPKSDPWLGLATRRDFTGLPGDGLVAPTP